MSSSPPDRSPIRDAPHGPDSEPAGAGDLGNLIAELFSPLAHDLRAGLNGISVWTHLLSRDGDEVGARAVEGIRRAVAHQSTLAQELSQFGAMVTAQRAQLAQRIDLRNLCAQVVQEVGASSPIPPTLSGSDTPQVLAHLELLRQVVRLLLLDAIAAAAAGTQVQVALHAGRAECTVEVVALPTGAGGAPRRATLRQSLAALAAGILGGRLEILPGEPSPRCILHLPVAA